MSLSSVAAAAGAVCVLAAASNAQAQAWAAPAGVGSVSFIQQTIDNTGHRLTDGSLLPQGQSVSQAVYVQVDYALTDRWAVSVGLPYVAAKYTGEAPPPASLQRDLCRCWHSGWQDWSASVQYNLVGRPTYALTPSVSVGVPSHAYAYEGEAVLGRQLREVRVGASAGARLDRVSPRLSAQLTYSYAFVEQVLDVPNNRSNGTVEGAFAVTRKLAARGTLSWQRTHGGLRAGTGPPVVPWGEITTDELFREHDRILRDNNVRLGAAVSYSLPRVWLFASVLQYVSGTDTHAGHALTVGVSIPFELSWRTKRP